MNRSRVRRTGAVALASALIHVVLILALAIGLPRLEPDRGQGPPAIEVTLERPPPPERPRPPQAPPKARQALHTPVARTTPPAIAPTPAPQVSALPPPTADSSEAAEAGDVVRALRASVGCSRPDAVDLTPAEREACRKRFRAGLETAPPLLSLTAEKRARFDHASRCQDAYRAYRAAQVPDSHTPSNGAGHMPGLGYIPSPRDCADDPPPSP